MCEIEKFVDDAVAKLENQNFQIGNIYNQPSHPLLFITNADDDEMRKAVLGKIRTIWPRAVTQIPFLSYTYTSSPDEGFAWKNQGGEDLSGDDVSPIFDELNSARDVFADMRCFNIYNIIKTSKLGSVEDFKNAYKASSGLSEFLNNGNIKVMDIVFLDGTNANLDLSNEIKRAMAELWNATPHDGALVMSNRMYGNGLCSEDRIFKIIGNAVVLSNNLDRRIERNNFDEREDKLYNGKINTVSYLSFERPDRDIAYCIIDKIIDEVLSEIQQTRREMSVNDVRNRLGMTPMFKLCEDYLYNMGTASVDRMMSLLKHVPIKPENSQLPEHITWEQLNKSSYPEVLEKILEDFLRDEAGAGANANSCLENFTKFAIEKISPSELSALRDNVIEAVFDISEDGPADGNTMLRTYIEARIRTGVQAKVLYPGFGEKLKKLKQAAQNTISDFRRFSESFKESLTPDGLGVMTDLYRNLADRYLAEHGADLKSKLIMPGNSSADFIAVILDMVSGIVASNTDNFNISLTDFMQERARLQGEGKFIAIINELERKETNSINIRGLYPIERTFEVFMLQTSVQGEDRPSELYTYLNHAFGDDSQYFNTYRDDSLEVMRFYDCSDGKMNRLG